MGIFSTWFDRRTNDIVVWNTYRRRAKRQRQEDKKNRVQLPKPPRGWKPGADTVSQEDLIAARAIRSAVQIQAADLSRQPDSRREIKASLPAAPQKLSDKLRGLVGRNAADPSQPPPMPKRMPALVRQPRHYTNKELVVRNVLIAASVIIFGFFGNLFVLSHLQHEVSQQQLSNQFREQLALATAPVSEGDENLVLLENGAPVAVIDIPALGVNEVIVEGTDSATLKKGPGHRRDTVLPGQAGISVIMARAAGYGGPFGNIQSLQPGTEFSVITGQGYHVYSVIGVRYAGDPGPAEPAEGIGRIVLETARGGPYTPSGILRVDAQLVSTSKTAPGQTAPSIVQPEATAKLLGPPDTSTGTPGVTSMSTPSATSSPTMTPTATVSPTPTPGATEQPGAQADIRNPSLALVSVKALDAGIRFTGTNTLPLAERELATDTSMVWALVFALQFLIVIEIAAVWAYRRVGLEKTWIVFIPLFVLTGLLVSDQLIRLLPNLL